MTSMTLPDEVLKTDVLGRVRIKKARRDALLDEFERGGTSAQAFAKLVGLKYQTFASWVQKRRRTRQQYPAATRALASTPAISGALRLVEAIAEPAVAQMSEGLIVHLPSGTRIEVRDARQAALAAELLKALGAARSC